jgi:hypothetical protein
MERQTYVDLPAIIAGTSIALAISIILLHFGSMMGIAITPDAEWNADTAYGQIITICLWGLWVQVLASLIGGYIAGIIRAPAVGSSTHEREMRDGIHGLTVWAFGTVLTAVGAAAVARDYYFDAARRSGSPARGGNSRPQRKRRHHYRLFHRGRFTGLGRGRMVCRHKRRRTPRRRCRPQPLRFFPEVIRYSASTCRKLSRTARLLHC